MKAFFDTNILIYAVGDDHRRDRAEALVNRGGIVSTQVLNEFVNVARKQMRWDWASVLAGLERIEAVVIDVTPLTHQAQQLGVSIARRQQLHIFDACIVASASLEGCDVVFSEDLKHGQVIEGVKIANPFL
ncbi:MAG: PIN domain-containing protein [Hyphomicrobiales bacterium]|jgi:predicted nucleic acid-binding protein|nr:PIN domain-containing protein [Hyphomicrobiales bacterium]